MRLDDTAGCPGRMRGRALAAICVACDRQGKPGPQIEPNVRRRTDGAAFCDERRYGAAHAPNVGTPQGLPSP